MEAVPVKERMTADEYLARPFEEGLRRQELVDGEVVVSAARPPTEEPDRGLGGVGERRPTPRGGLCPDRRQAR